MRQTGMGRSNCAAGDAGRSGITFGQSGPGKDTKEGGAVNEDKVKDNV